LFNLLDSVPAALADAGTTLPYLTVPDVPTKVLGPEGPGSALTGTDRVHPATIPAEHDAGPTTRPENVETFRTLHIPPVEFIVKEVQVGGHLLKVFAIHVDLRVLAFVPAALAALLAGKLQPVPVPNFVHVRSDRGD
jgi:hypothetical protein